MSKSFRLTIATPAALLIDASDVRAVRAEDESGGFGLLPGHADFLTVLPASVLRWRCDDGVEHYCVLQGGLLTTTGGDRVSVACRHGVLGNDLPQLEEDVRRMRAERADAAARARVEQTRLHAQAVRQLIRYLRPSTLSESALFDGEAQ
jgi:F-type H+-transporting ATPase subunit epsilon